MIESFEDWYANNRDADYDDVVAKVKQWVKFCENVAYDEGYEDGASDTYERELG